MSALTLPELDIVRTTLVPCGLRAADETTTSDREGLGLMDVRFSPFNSWYRIDSFWEGSFLERTVPGAFKRTIASHNKATKVDAHNIKTLFNHGQDMFIGQKLLGDIDELVEDSDSPRSTVWLWDTSYNRDLLPGLRSGAYGSSFMFRVVKEEWNEEPGQSEHNPDGLPERTVKEARVFEAGPVTWPASPTASAGMRCVSATDTYYEHLARQDPQRVNHLRSKLTALRSNGPADGTPKDPGLATAPPTDSARSHSGGLTPAQRRQRLYPILNRSGHESGRTPRPARSDRD
jgi:phage head maturation protease